MRESPAIEIVHNQWSIIRLGGSVKAFDPVAMDEAKHFIDGIEYAHGRGTKPSKGPMHLLSLPNGTSSGHLTWKRSRRLLKSPKDRRSSQHLRTGEDMRELGFEYVGVGR